jgi:hypothetical protein
MPMIGGNIIVWLGWCVSAIPACHPAPQKPGIFLSAYYRAQFIIRPGVELAGMLREFDLTYTDH